MGVCIPRISRDIRQNWRGINKFGAAFHKLLARHFTNFWLWIPQLWRGFPQVWQGILQMYNAASHNLARHSTNLARHSTNLARQSTNTARQLCLDFHKFGAAF
jgi:hypothetical protein